MRRSGFTALFADPEALRAWADVWIPRVCVPMRHRGNHRYLHALQRGVLNERAEREALLQAWVDAGHDLGNHTRDHPSLFDTPLAAFQKQVRQGDLVTNRLLAARGDSARYFRHPYLNAGPDLETKRAFEAWLPTVGYTVAPVTHDNSEWLYAFAYDNAAQSGDAADEYPAQILHVLEERLDWPAEFLAVFVQLGHRVVAIGVTAAWNR